MKTGPINLYIREARRMIGDFMLTDADALGKTTIKRPIGTGSYPMNFNNIHRYVTGEPYVQNEVISALNPIDS
ncbi:MAG: FAD-dependent oxidoreductase [Chitinophagaceae bacterium]